MERVIFYAPDSDFPESFVKQIITHRL